jgi:diguanylate cyclase (GGDEF)-like protein
METASSINSLCSENDKIAIFRLDISHFKQVNDNFGFDVGDNVIVACYNIINNCINNTLIHSTLGRAHGDEFIVFAKANLNKIEKIAEEIIAEMQTFDFSSIGCDLQMGCYIGGLVSTSGSLSDIRMMIEGSIDMIEQARSKGKNSFVVRDL